MSEVAPMTLSKNELIDMIERIDEISAALDEFRHRFVQDLEEIEQGKTNHRK
jgi:hypothetical protein